MVVERGARTVERLIGKERRMKNNRMKDALENIARRGIPENTNIWPRLSARLERKSLTQTIRTRPVLIVIVVVTFLLLSGVVYALGRSLGYLPGIGIVDQSVPIRVLAEPVTVQKQGITITVSKVVADSTRTFISYRVDGIPLSEDAVPACATIPEMHLADGTHLEDKTGSGGTGVLLNENAITYEDEKIFSPIPDETNNVILVLSCILPDGSALENFELSLNLVPAPAGFATSAAEVAVTADGAENKTGLHLEKVLELKDSYILIGKFTDGGDLPGPLYMSTSSDSEYLPHIEDANGNPVSFKVREDARPDPDWDVAYYWAYEIPKPIASPLKITVDRVNIRKHNTAQFQFDTGDHPQVMQEWKFNQPVKVGAYTFVLDAIAFIGNGYVLNLSYDNLPKNVSFYVGIIDNPSNPFQFDGGNETQNQVGNKTLDTITLTSKNPPPAGKLIVEWQLDEAVPQVGPWSLVWTPSKTKP
jgi:hypothetical protein